MEENLELDMCPMRGPRKSRHEKMIRCIVFALWALIFHSFIILPSPAVAREHEGTGPGADPTVMETMVVTADRVEDYVKKHPGQVEILDRNSIDQRNMLSVEEALRSMPGVDVKESSGIGSRISIRGSGKSGGVLVLLNGRPLNSSQFGSTDLSTIPIDIIKSITVFKPPVPVWLGPGGSDGAILIVTGDPAGKKAKKRHWTKIRGAGGSFGLAEGSVSHRVKTASATYAGTASGKHRDGKRTNSDRNSGNLSLHWDRDLTGAAQIEVDGRYYLSEYGSPGPLDNPTPDARQAYQKASLDSRLHGVLTAAWDFNLNLYGDLVGLEDRAQSGFVSTLDSTKLGWKGESNYSGADEIWRLRLDGIVERDDVDHTLTGVHDRTTTGIGAQADRNWKPLTATLGLRGDYTSDFYFSPGADGGISFHPAGHWTAKVNVGYKEQIPTFGQLYQPSHGSIDQVRGNPDLKAEKTWSYDTGLEYHNGKTLLCRFTLFRSNTGDQIVYQRGADLVYQPINVDSAWRHGVEATIKVEATPDLIVDFDAIVQDSAIDGTDKELPYTPRVKLKATLQYTLATPGTRFESTARYCGKQYSEVENREAQQLDEYVTVDLKATQPFTIKTVAMEWFVTLENLLDAEYEIHYGYPDDGLRFVTGMNWTF